MPEITLVVFVALGAFLTGSGVTGFVAFKAVRIGWELALDDRRLEPGAVVGQLPAPAAEQPVWTPPEAVNPDGPPPDTGRHCKPAVSLRDYSKVVHKWPPADEDTQVLVPVRDEVKA